MQQWLFPGEAEHLIPSCIISVNRSGLSISRWVIRINTARPFVTVHKCAIKMHQTPVFEKPAASTGSCVIPTAPGKIRVGRQAKPEGVTKPRWCKIPELWAGFSDKRGELGKKGIKKVIKEVWKVLVSYSVWPIQSQTPLRSHCLVSG